MNSRSKLGKIRLRTTPRRCALDFVEALLNPPVDPAEILVAKLADMQAETQTQVDPRQAGQEIEDLKADTLWLIQLHAAALGSLLDVMVECFHLASFALAYLGVAESSHPKFCPPLLKKLVAARNKMFVRVGVLDLVRLRHFRTEVVPDWFLDHLLFIQDALLLALAAGNNLHLEHFDFLDNQGGMEQAEQALRALENPVRRAAATVEPGWTAWLLRNKLANFMTAAKEFACMLSLLAEDGKQELERLEHAPENHTVAPPSTSEAAGPKRASRRSQKSQRAGP